MQRALTSTLRLTRPCRALQARGCASVGATGVPEIQVHALAGRDQGECAVPVSTQEAEGCARTRQRSAEPGAWHLGQGRSRGQRDHCT